MSKQQVTIRDLAIKLDISISTVSRALRGSSEINPDTKKAVLDLAEKLNYEPNQIAQSLRNSKTNIIGIIVPKISDYFFSTVISSIQEEAQKEGFTIMICQSNEQFLLEVENVKTMISCRVDGMILSVCRETESIDHIVKMQNRNIPIVIFDREIDGLKASKVLVNDYEGALTAVSHLISSGYRRIAYLAGPKNMKISNSRKKGYLEALNNHNLPADKSLIIHCEKMEEEAKKQSLELLGSSNPPDAFFAFNDPMALEIYKGIYEMGLKIPQDIGLVGFTDSPIASLIRPSLTSVSQPAEEMGKIATKMLVQLIKNKGKNKPGNVLLKTELIIRESTNKNNHQIQQ